MILENDKVDKQVPMLNAHKDKRPKKRKEPEPKYVSNIK